MKKLIAILCAVFVLGMIAACSEQPKKTGNSAEVQRAHADKAQGELSSETKK